MRLGAAAAEEEREMVRWRHRRLPRVRLGVMVGRESRNNAKQTNKPLTTATD